jgi:hypothetical protein
MSPEMTPRDNCFAFSRWGFLVTMAHSKYNGDDDDDGGFEALLSDVSLAYQLHRLGAEGSELAQGLA